MYFALKCTLFAPVFHVLRSKINQHENGSVKERVVALLQKSFLLPIGLSTLRAMTASPFLQFREISFCGKRNTLSEPEVILPDEQLFTSIFHKITLFLFVDKLHFAQVQMEDVKGNPLVWKRIRLVELACSRSRRLRIARCRVKERK